MGSLTCVNVSCFAVEETGFAPMRDRLARRGRVPTSQVSVPTRRRRVTTSQAFEVFWEAEK